MPYTSLTVRVQNCQEFLRTLNAALPPSALPPHARLVVVGCGDPSMIRFYADASACTYPIYADPSRALYAHLGLIRTLELGAAAPDYMRRSLPRVVLESIGQGLKQGRNAFKGGDLSQVGGEFWVDGRGEVRWAHRMRNTRDHAEVPALLKVIGVSGSVRERRAGLVKRLSVRGMRRKGSGEAVGKASGLRA